MEVMGLMLGEFVDDYTVRVIDVFAMPQSGTVKKKASFFFILIYLSISKIIYSVFLTKGCECGGRRFRISNKDVRYAKANWTVVLIES